MRKPQNDASHRVVKAARYNGALGGLQRTHSVQGAVRIHETEVSLSVVRATSLTQTTLDSATGHSARRASASETIVELPASSPGHPPRSNRGASDETSDPESGKE